MLLLLALCCFRVCCAFVSQQRVDAYGGLSALGSATPPLPHRFYEAKSPKLLLHEWCVREKVPRPRYRPTAMEGGLWKCKVSCSRVTVCMGGLRRAIDSRRGRRQEAPSRGRPAKARLLAGVHATAAIASTVVWSTLLLQRSMMLVLVGLGCTLPCAAVFTCWTLLPLCLVQVVLPHPKKQELDVVVFLDDSQVP